VGEANRQGGRISPLFLIFAMQTQARFVQHLFFLFYFFIILGAFAKQ
jgi:hypothetical protein